MAVGSFDDRTAPLYRLPERLWVRHRLIVKLISKGTRREMDPCKLANDLIELRCDRPAFGTFYDFLLKAYGDADKAKADFTSFVCGGLPPRMVEAATEWIVEEHTDGR